KSNAIRYNSASGGLVTSLLIFALENRIIDGALVTKMNERKPLEPEVFLARTEEEISLASKSKYCPVPVNVALKEILKEGGRFAVVGLPCHIQGIRKYEIVNKELKEKIVLHLGLFCSNTPSFLATDYILTRARCKKEEIIKIDYRGQGWPGNMRIKFRDGSTLTLTDYWGTGFGQYFSPIRCIFCIDQTNELADISFGDAWLPDVIKKDKIGTSIVISRTKIGQEILEKATINNIISLNSINRDKVVQSQGNIWSFKKTNLRTRILLLRFFNKKEHPIYTSARLLEPGFNDFLKMTFRFLGRSMASKKSLWNVINSYAYLSNFLVRLLERHKRF
ncbi:MAG: Coenzyme F420 hydrogenase/dehydrogenase, beta subunit C-terminal domain, partial [Nitrososphaerales archaeon]